jgi:probable F420-dependent oxidoreductase
VFRAACVLRRFGTPTNIPEETEMEIGVYTILTDQTMLPGETAKLIEDAGLDAMAMGEHSHIPSSRESAYPGGDLPAAYARTLDLFVTFSAGAAATTRLRFESSIIQIAQRDPITTAKAAASVDFLSGGRLDLIVGHGWNVEEMRNHGVDPATRYELVRERMLAMRRIFQHDVATYHGEYVNFDAIWCWPKPVQPSGVPLILGGNSPGAEERALEYGDGWAPIEGPGILERVAAFTSANPDVPVHVAGVATDSRQIARYAEAGAARIILGLGEPIAGEAERTVEALRRAVDDATG